MRYIDPAINYEQTAMAWAEKLDSPFDHDGENFHRCMGLLNALFRGIHPETIDAIEIDPVAFSDRVAAYRHNLAS